MTGVSQAVRGGTSTVCHGHLDGVPCVMKIADASASSVASLEREARVLVRLSAPLAPTLVGHVRTREGRAALALEPIDGVAVSEWCRRAPLARRLAVATRFLERVAGIHSRGVIHGDLSGRNVLVTADDDVRVIDFGSSQVIGAPGCGGPRLATPAYLAPVRDDDDVAIADDIYAAGVILFELCTGRLPFTGHGRALRQAHETRRPPLVSHIAPVSRAIERVIVRCLAKAPARRYADGAALHAAWIDAVAVEGPLRLARGTMPVPVLAPADDRTVHAALLGFRDGADPMEALRIIEASGGVVAHRGAGVSVAACWRGAAPDRVATSVRRRLAAIGCTGFAAGTAPLRVDARGLVRGAALLDTAARVGASADGDRECASAAASSRTPLVGRDHELALVCKTIVEALDTQRALAIRIEGEAGAGKTRFLDELMARVRGETTSGLAIVRITGEPGATGPADAATRALEDPSASGLVIVVDDAQWIEPRTIEHLERATRVTAARPLVVVTAARPGGFDALAPSHGHTFVRLCPLDESSARQLCRALLPDVLAVPAAVIERMAAHAGGVPLAIHELVRALRAEGVIRNGRVHVDALDLCAGVDVIEWAVDRELERLGGPLSGHAFVAALLGPGIDAAATANVLALLDERDQGECAPLDAAIAIGRLVSHGLLHVQDATVTFRHSLVRDAVLGRAPAAHRRAIAAAALDALGDRVGDVIRATWAEIAGRDEDALAAWRVAGAIAAARHDYVTAEHASDRALHLSRDHGRGELLRRRAIARYRLGRHATSAVDFAAAAEMTSAPWERARLLLDEAMALDWARDFTAAERCTAAASSLVEGCSDDAPPADLQAALAVAIGRARWRAGDARAARAPLEAAVTIASGLGDGEQEIAIVGAVILGWVFAEIGELDEAERVLADARERARAAADRMHEAAALNNLAFVHWQRGCVDELASIFERVVAIGRELGMPTHEYRATRWMFEASLATGVSDAHALARRLVTLEDGFPELFAAREGRVALARVAACAGDLTASAAYLDGAADSVLVMTLRRATVTPASAEVWCSGVDRAASEGDVETAMELALRGLESLRREAAGAPTSELRARIERLSGDRALSPAVRAAARAALDESRCTP